MTCNDCLYYAACKNLLEILNPKLKGKRLTFTKQCDNFKNKSDFVEVVRCEKCKHGNVSIISRTIDGKETIACYCNVKGKLTDVDSYCPSGERK